MNRYRVVSVVAFLFLLVPMLLLDIVFSPINLWRSLVAREAIERDIVEAINAPVGVDGCSG